MSDTENGIDYQAIKKILVIQFRPFGDVLLATSYLEAIKKKFKRASVDFLVKKPFHHVLHKNPWISKIIAFEQRQGFRYLTSRLRLFRDIRARRYDLIIDQQNGTGSGQVVLFSNARFKLGWSDGKWSKIYNLKAKRKSIRYRASQNFDMLQPLGIAERPYRFYYYIKADSITYAQAWLERHGMIPQETIIVSPGSPRTRKKWHPKNFSRLIDMVLSNTNMKVIILWGPKEYDDACAVLNQTRKICRLAPPTDFNQAAAFLRNCRLLICNDGGLNHLSVALNVPSLAIFGNTNVAKWSPQGFFPHHYHLVNPDWKSKSDNHFGITSQDAFQKVLEILGQPV